MAKPSPSITTAVRNSGCSRTLPPIRAPRARAESRPISLDDQVEVLVGASQQQVADESSDGVDTHVARRRHLADHWQPTQHRVARALGEQPPDLPVSHPAGADPALDRGPFALSRE